MTLGFVGTRLSFSGMRLVFLETRLVFLETRLVSPETRLVSPETRRVFAKAPDFTLVEPLFWFASTLVEPALPLSPAGARRSRRASTQREHEMRRSLLAQPRLSAVAMHSS
jgi:hypothetical protein